MDSYNVSACFKESNSAEKDYLKNVTQLLPQSDKYNENYAREYLYIQKGNQYDSRKASLDQQMFKDGKFNGDIQQDILWKLRMYQIYARKYYLSSFQNDGLFVHVSDDGACILFFENCYEGMTYGEMAKVMTDEYMSDARQLQV